MGGQNKRLFSGQRPFTDNNSNELANCLEHQSTTTVGGTTAGSIWRSLVWTTGGLQIAFGLFYILCTLHLYIEKTLLSSRFL